MEHISTEEFCLENTCVTLGKFDGIHLGHRLLLQRLARSKEKNSTKSVVFTFAFHPDMFFGSKSRLIYTNEEKEAILMEEGVDVLISYPFTKETSAMEPEDFIEQILVKKLGAKKIVVGCDNRFGHNRRGDVAMLKEFSKKCGFCVEVCDKVKDGEDVISSTLIRQEIERGNLERANRMLGAPFHILGHYSPNVPSLKEREFCMKSGSNEKLLPPNGIYATRTTFPCKVAHMDQSLEVCFPAASGPKGISGITKVNGKEIAWLETRFPDHSEESIAFCGSRMKTEFLKLL